MRNLLLVLTCVVPALTAREAACTVRLDDGRILVAGGRTDAGPSASAELFADGTSQPAAYMRYPRARHTCTLLADGRVLAMGGEGVSRAEIYSPERNEWTDVEGQPLWPREGHTATRMEDGSVIFAGGESGGAPLDLVERFDPASERLHVLPFRLRIARTGHSAVVLPDGRIWIAGGGMGTEWIDVSNGVTSAGPELPGAGDGIGMAELLDGRIFLAGGGTGRTWLYTPEDGIFREGPRLQAVRARVQALRIPNNGNVLVLSDGSAELFDAVRERMEPQGLALGESKRFGKRAFIDIGDILVMPTVTPNKSFYVAGEQATLRVVWNRDERVTVNVRKRVVGAITTELVTRQVVTPPATVALSSLQGNTEVTAVATGESSGTTAQATFLVGTPTTVVLTRTPNPARVRDTVTIQVQITGSINVSGAPAGTLQIFDQESRIATLSTSDATAFQATSNGGVFTFRTKNLAVGSHALTAVFTRTGGLYATSPRSAVVGLEVVKRVALFQVLPINNRLARPDMSMLVSALDNDVLPTGTLTVAEGTSGLAGGTFFQQTIGTATRSVASAGPFPAGTKLITRFLRLSYSGDANFESATWTERVVILRAIPEFAVPAEPVTITLGQILRLDIPFGPLSRLTVSSSFSENTGDANPTALPAATFSLGSVTIQSDRVQEDTGFIDRDPLGNPLPCTNTLPLPLDRCKTTTGFRSSILMGALGTGTLRITYPGDTAYEAVTRSIPVTVVKGAPDLQIFLAQEGSAANRQVRVTVQVFAPPSLFPTGSLAVFDGATLVGTIPLGAPVSGEVLISSVLAPVNGPGPRTYRVVYAGDANWLATEAERTLTVR